MRERKGGLFLNFSGVDSHTSHVLCDLKLNKFKVMLNKFLIVVRHSLSELA